VPYFAELAQCDQVNYQLDEYGEAFGLAGRPLSIY
jgi:hypothetical protein